MVQGAHITSPLPAGFLFFGSRALSEKKNFSITDFYLITAMVIWGSDYPLAKIALQEVSPLSFAAVRTLLSTFFILPFFLKWEKSWFVSWRDFFWLSVLALLGTFLNRLFWSYGLASTTASNSALIMATSPIYVLILSALFFRGEVTLRSVLGVVTAFIGVALVIKNDWQGWGILSQTLLGDLFIMAASFCWSLLTILAKRILKDHSSLKVTTYIMLISSILFIPFVPNEKPGGLWGISYQAQFSVLYVAIMGNGIAYFLFIQGIKSIGPLRTILYQYLSPVAAILFAIPILGETLTASQVWGALIIFGGIFLARSG